MLNVAVTAAAVFVSSIGVNTHIDFQNYGYQNLGVTEQAIKYLGVTSLRDDPENPADVGSAGWWQQVADATGAKFNAFMAEGSVSQMQSDLGRAQQMAKQGIIDFIEGGNEEDDPYAQQNENSLGAAAAFQSSVFAAAQALSLPTINMSFGQGWSADNSYHGNYDKVGDLAGVADYANAHTYPNGPPLSSIQLLYGDARLAASRPVIQTEFGYDTNSTSQQDAAVWTVDALADSCAMGITKTYIYALFDDGSGNFGLMNQDGSPKPAGAAIHNLVTILSGGDASVQTSSLDYSFTGLPSTASTLVLQKAPGIYDLLVWDESGGSGSVTLNAAGTIAVYDPVQGAGAIGSGPQFQLGRDLLVLEVRGAGAPEAVPANTVAQADAPVAPVPAPAFQPAQAPSPAPVVQDAAAVPPFQPAPSSVSPTFQPAGDDAGGGFGIPQVTNMPDGASGPTDDGWRDRSWRHSRHHHHRRHHHHNRAEQSSDGQTVSAEN